MTMKNEHSESKKQSGALRSELQIELHTHYAISAWKGRQKTLTTHEIAGMPNFFWFAGRINRDSLKDNPYADAMMLKLEELINEAHQLITEKIAEADKIISELNNIKNMTVTESISAEPINISVYSNTPIGYKCVYLLVGFDQLTIKVLQAYHYGLISRTHQNDILQEVSKIIRRIIGLAKSYRSLNISRSDIANETEFAKKILQENKIDSDILLGSKRSMFSPPLNKESITNLKNSNFIRKRR